MERIKKFGLAGGMLAVALLLGGRGAHAGFSVGKSSTPTQTQLSKATVVQSQLNETSE